MNSNSRVAPDWIFLCMNHLKVFHHRFEKKPSKVYMIEKSCCFMQEVFFNICLEIDLHSVGKKIKVKLG